MSTENLGLVKAIHIGTSAPANTNMIWYDDNTGQKIHKYYNVTSAAWLPIGNRVSRIGNIDAGWYDADDNIVIPHNGDTLFFNVIVKDDNGDNINAAARSVDENNVIIYCGKVFSSATYILDLYY
jgi:hypothetical protein